MVQQYLALCIVNRIMPPNRSTPTIYIQCTISMWTVSKTVKCEPYLLARSGNKDSYTREWRIIWQINISKFYMLLNQYNVYWLHSFQFSRVLTQCLCQSHLWQSFLLMQSLASIYCRLVAVPCNLCKRHVLGKNIATWMMLKFAKVYPSEYHCSWQNYPCMNEVTTEHCVSSRCSNGFQYNIYINPKF